MEALRIVKDFRTFSDTSKRVLIGILYNDLKKLREN